MRRWLALAIVLAFCGWSGVSLAAEAEWSGWRGPQRDGKSPETGLLKSWPEGGAALLWKVSGLGKGFSSASVADGRVYITGDEGGSMTLFAFDLDGRPLWKTVHGPAWKNDPPGSRSTPVVSGGRLYIVGADGRIGCYDAATGAPKWDRSMREFGGSTPGWGYAESVLLYEKMAIVTPGGKNCIVALDQESGKTIWMSSGFDGRAHYGSCIAAQFEGVPLIIAGTGGGLVAVDARDGRAHWSHTFSAGNVANCPTPAYADGYVFWSNGYGKGGICLRLKKAGERVSADVAWTTRELVSHHGGYVIDQGYIYGNHEGGWACLDLKTGQRKWFERAVGKGSLCWADGMLYLFGESGGAVALATCSPEGLTVKGRLRVQGEGPSWAHPSVSGGRLYVRYDQNLYCFNLRP